MKQVMKSIAMSLFGCVILLILVEGTLGWMHTIRTIQVRITMTRPWISKHLDFDPLLGWISKPNLNVQDMFGPGKNLTTDEHRFRITPGISTDQTTNVVCIGDSFTFGFGVDDAETWCSLLSTGNWKTYNMGQDAYGLDQIFLRYQRDGNLVPHSIVIAALIGDDLERMAAPSLFESLDKPHLQLEHGALMNTNYPIRLKPTWNTVLMEMRAGLGELRTYITIQKIVQGFNQKTGRDDEITERDGEVAAAIVHQMNDLAKKRGAQLVVVLLPTYPLASTKQTVLGTYEKNRLFLQKSADDDGFLFIDVGETIYQADPDTLASYFIQPEDFHNTKTGHAVIAKIIRERIERGY